MPSSGRCVQNGAKNVDIHDDPSLRWSFLAEERLFASDLKRRSADVNKQTAALSDARLLPYKQTRGGWNGLMQQCQHAIQRLKPAFPLRGRNTKTWESEMFINTFEQNLWFTNHFIYKHLFSIVFFKFGVFGTFCSYLKFFTMHLLPPWNQNNGISAFS